MGITHSTARWLAPLSLVVNMSSQAYGMLTTPNMQDIHEANVSFFSPHPAFIGAFFTSQQIFQLMWLYHLCRPNSRGRLSFLRNTDPNNQDIEDDLSLMVDYAPYYTLGNFCIAAWCPLWVSSNLTLAFAPVALNTIIQLYYLFIRLPSLPHKSAIYPGSSLPKSTIMNLSSTSSFLTHVVIKTFAGISILDFIHNGSLVFFNHGMAVSNMTKVLTGLGFATLTLAGGKSSDFIFGGSLVYDLAGLAVGQRVYGNVEWSKMLGIYAGATGLMVGLKNMLWWPYARRSGEGYETLR
ncbi:hypothetical protein QBC37DRAFT_300531 [Rhypophila decipiens]|uniref:Derlin n=1 Tax=Rhypophila decipiens TaxID=261697 RepID=A0AAN6XZL7_9PEZI|nr:hypothetical protein QBC37DRAFT_300531 [Rhypophila decipiens]